MSRGGARECEFEQNERREEVGKPVKGEKKKAVGLRERAWREGGQDRSHQPGPRHCSTKGSCRQSDKDG